MNNVTPQRLVCFMYFTAHNGGQGASANTFSRLMVYPGLHAGNCAAVSPCCPHSRLLRSTTSFWNSSLFEKVPWRTVSECSITQNSFIFSSCLCLTWLWLMESYISMGNNSHFVDLNVWRTITKKLHSNKVTEITRDGFDNWTCAVGLHMQSKDGGGFTPRSQRLDILSQ